MEQLCLSLGKRLGNRFLNGGHFFERFLDGPPEPCRFPLRIVVDVEAGGQVVLE